MISFVKPNILMNTFRNPIKDEKSLLENIKKKHANQKFKPGTQLDKFKPGAKPKGYEDTTPLILATQWGYKEVVMHLIDEMGASLEQTDLLNKMPLDYAIEIKNIDIGLLLLEKIKKNPINDIKMLESFARALRGNYLSLVQAILECNPHVWDLKNKEEQNWLHMAVLANAYTVVPFLLEKGIDFRVRDAKQWSPYDMSLSKMTPQILKCFLEQGALPIINWLGTNKIKSTLSIIFNNKSVNPIDAGCCMGLLLSAGAALDLTVLNEELLTAIGFKGQPQDGDFYLMGEYKNSQMGWMQRSITNLSRLEAVINDSNWRFEKELIANTTWDPYIRDKEHVQKIRALLPADMVAKAKERVEKLQPISNRQQPVLVIKTREEIKKLDRTSFLLEYPAHIQRYDIAWENLEKQIALFDEAKEGESALTQAITSFFEKKMNRIEYFYHPQIEDIIENNLIYIFSHFAGLYTKAQVDLKDKALFTHSKQMCDLFAQLIDVHSALLNSISEALLESFMILHKDSAAVLLVRYLENEQACLFSKKEIDGIYTVAKNYTVPREQKTFELLLCILIMIKQSEYKTAIKYFYEVKQTIHQIVMLDAVWLKYFKKFSEVVQSKAYSRELIILLSEMLQFLRIVFYEVDEDLYNEIQQERVALYKMQENYTLLSFKEIGQEISNTFSCFGKIEVCNLYITLHLNDTKDTKSYRSIAKLLCGKFGIFFEKENQKIIFTYKLAYTLENDLIDTLRKLLMQALKANEEPMQCKPYNPIPTFAALTLTEPKEKVKTRGTVDASYINTIDIKENKNVESEIIGLTLREDESPLISIKNSMNRFMTVPKNDPQFTPFHKLYRGKNSQAFDEDAFIRSIPSREQGEQGIKIEGEVARLKAIGTTQRAAAKAEHYTTHEGEKVTVYRFTEVRDKKDEERKGYGIS